MKRRDVLKSLGLLPLVARVSGLEKFSNPAPTKLQPSPKRDLFKELGVRTFINARGTITFMSGSLMHEEVLETIKDTATAYCMIDDLQDKVGAKIAGWTHAESATVTSGAFSALSLGMAGALTGTDAQKVRQLPNLTGMKSEVIIQKGHGIDYNHALTNCGVTMVSIETREDLEKAINDKTALMHFLNANTAQGQIKHAEWLEVAKKHGIPAMIDMAADVPPKENLWKFNDMGFDLVCVSGGKAIRGPQSSGILMGKKHLIEAARMNAAPRSFTIGRGMKVNKEEILGLYVALDHYIHEDHDKEWKLWEDQIAYVNHILKALKGVTTTVFVPEVANHCPTLRVSWDSSLPFTAEQLQLKLRNGNPSIEINPGNRSIEIATWMMIPGEEKELARRLKEEFLNIKQG